MAAKVVDFPLPVGPVTNTRPLGRRADSVPAKADADRTITALFRAVGDPVDRFVTLTFAAQPGGAGSVSHTSLTVAKGTPVTLNGDRSLTIGGDTVRATAASGQVFAGWDSVPAKADADRTITALFRAVSDPADRFVTLTFAAQPGGAGSVSHTSLTMTNIIFIFAVK